MMDKDKELKLRLALATAGAAVKEMRDRARALRGEANRLEAIADNLADELRSAGVKL
jgi:hypothetical protein